MMRAWHWHWCVSGGVAGTRPAAVCAVSWWMGGRLVVVQVHAGFSQDTIASRKQREVCRVPRDWWLPAHVVVVVALRRRRRHERRRRRQTRRPSPRAACEGVHGGERADVAHARGALAAGRLRPAARSLRRPPTPAPRALFDRRPPSAFAIRPPTRRLALFWIFNLSPFI